MDAVFRNPVSVPGVLSLSRAVCEVRRGMAAPTDGVVSRDVTGGIPGIEDEHASLFGVGVVGYGGHRKSDGAESLVDTSIRRCPNDDAEVTEVQVQV
jgi:hypothetical protein